MCVFGLKTDIDNISPAPKNNKYCNLINNIKLKFIFLDLMYKSRIILYFKYNFS